MPSFKSRILDVVDETPRVKIFNLSRPSDFSFSSGQFVMVSVEGFKGKEGALVKRSYSIASSPYDKDLQLCITRAENGQLSNALHNLKAGDQLDIQGPFGVFRLKEPVAENTTFVAGGSGIAPVRSMLRSILYENAAEGIRLFYGFRGPDEFIYKKELEQYAGEKKLALLATIDSPVNGWKGNVGFVSEVLKKNADYEKTDAYVCGPPPMVAATMKALSECGFSSERIFREQW